jgi:hypothetical protein
VVQDVLAKEESEARGLGVHEGGVQPAVVLGVGHHERGGERVGDVDEDTALAGKDLEDTQSVRQAPDRGARVRLLDARREPVADGAS